MPALALNFACRVMSTTSQTQRQNPLAPTQLLKETKDMLQSYSAELQGNQLRWLGAEPPHLLPPQKVLVVMEFAAPVAPAPHVAPDADAIPKPRYQLRDLAGRLQWAGDAVQAQREQRDAW